MEDKITLVCRCCLSEVTYKDTPSTAKQAEVTKYLAMVIECFTVNLASSHKSGICESCAKEVEACIRFKRRVLATEEEFVKKHLAVFEDTKPLIKVELADSAADDSDDYFLADTASRNVSIKTEESDRNPPATKGSKHANKKKKIKTTSLSNIIKKIRLRKDEKTEKQKHAYNLQTILEFSNATVFKNKSLLGYQCGFCQMSFPDPADLRAHTYSAHQKDRSFKPSDLLENSIKVDITDLRCNLCDDRFENLQQLKSHLSKAHSKTIYNDIKDHVIQFKLKQGDEYDCSLCSSTYETFKMLAQHMNLHYNNYKCSECETSFATKRSLSAHKNVHIEGSYKCNQCEKVFQSKLKRQYHERIKHLGSRNIRNCAYCDAPFRSYYQRNQHMIKVHNTEAQYKCKVCDKSYLLKSLLMSHIKKNHLMERNKQCAECGFKFFSNKALKAHMVKHTGERNYMCNVCNKAYARKYTLKEHMRIHNNDRRFKCGVCELSFVQKCSLKSHLLSNHGISIPASEITCS